MQGNRLRDHMKGYKSRCVRGFRLGEGNGITKEWILRVTRVENVSPSLHFVSSRLCLLSQPPHLLLFWDGGRIPWRIFIPSLGLLMQSHSQ